MSAGVPTRPRRKAAAPISARRSAGRSAKGPVAVLPGPTALTVIRRAANSRAATLVSWSMNAFAPEYSELPGTAELVTPEAMLITRPPSESVPAASFISRNGARTSTATTRSKDAASIWATGRQKVTPALFTRMSSRPSSPSAASATAAGAVTSAKSAWMASTLRPRPRTDAATSSASAWPVLYVNATSAPSDASRRTISAPMPRLPPVTSAALPARRPSPVILGLPLGR